MSKGLARHIVRLYPRAWRARYEREILPLVEDSGASAWQTIDLARGCAGEWMVACFGQPHASRLARGLVFAVVAGLSYLLSARIVAMWPATQTAGRTWMGGPTILIAILEWRLLWLTALPPRISTSLDLLAKSRFERRFLDLFLRATSVESRFRIPQPGELELWVLTVCGFSAALLDQWAAQSGGGFSLIGAFICGQLALAWMFRRPATTSAPEPVR